jgi:hypothetical protein
MMTLFSMVVFLLKVAASRAMQQNTRLKQDLEELQKEIINLNNG